MGHAVILAGIKTVLNMHSNYVFEVQSFIVCLFFIYKMAHAEQQLVKILK